MSSARQSRAACGAGSPAHVEALTSADLDAFPIWEQDETGLLPLERGTIPRDAVSLSVAADFTTADGTPFVGIVALSTDEEIAFGGAGLLSNGAYIYAAHGEKTPLRYKTKAKSHPAAASLLEF